MSSPVCCYHREMYDVSMFMALLGFGIGMIICFEKIIYLNQQNYIQDSRNARH